MQNSKSERRKSAAQTKVIVRGRMPPAERRCSEPIGWALDSHGATIEDVRVDHRGTHIGMTEQLLDSADVVAIFQEVRGERMALMPRAA